MRPPAGSVRRPIDRKSTRLNSSHPSISYAVFCLKKKNPHARSHDLLLHDVLAFRETAAMSPPNHAVLYYHPVPDLSDRAYRRMPVRQRTATHHTAHQHATL